MSRKAAFPIAALWVAVMLYGAIVYAPQGVAALHRLVWPPPCGAALQLTVITAPENISAVRKKATEFTRTASVDGCPKYQILVSPTPPITELIRGLDNDWRQDSALVSDTHQSALGLYPNAWIADSTGEVGYVRGKLTESVLPPVLGRSVGSDRLVVAMGAHEADELRLFSGLALRDVTARLGPPLHPLPGISTAGLIAAADLMAAGEADAAANTARGGGSVIGLMCEVARTRDDEWGRTALLIPKHAVIDYNRSGLDQEGCKVPRPRAGKLDLRPLSSPDLSTLDYPFVTINWTDTVKNPELRRAAGEFECWLVAHPLFDATPGTCGRPDKSVPEPSRGGRATDADALTTAYTDFENKVPRIVTEMVLDVSGSMSRQSADLLARTRKAFPAIGPILNEDDRISLGRFYKKGDTTDLPNPSGNQSRTQLPQLAQRIAAPAPRLPDGRISEMIGLLDDHEDSFTVAVITDGGPLGREGRTPEKAIAEAIAENPKIHGLYILVIGEGACPRGLPDRQERRAGQAGRMVCVKSGPDVENALRTMITHLRKW
ncbi:hypothetical protein DP939_30365 [Spongiactinospora rosea]|uniref:VWFA domain-containing protein n=1 Tax=Spongiactinospora rosea TaxID=2248750 RepID=A0A366LR30_9ACTN|nr:VWA domain-containing protein [Spongiactinospora rosea]RBQ16277.1 hypothetical protein DP939_30365 [Spongiactinospora rosea]